MMMIFSSYEQLLDDITEKIPAHYFEYISIGVVRFTKDVYRQVQLNYPKSDLLVGEFIKPEGGKVRYPGALRKAILNKIQKMCLERFFKTKPFISVWKTSLSFLDESSGEFQTIG